MEPFLGEIRLFAFGLVPRGWLACQGQLLAIQSNAALFSLLGVYYGGNGTSNFGLPDLRGRVAVDMDGAEFPIGARVGTESVTLTSQTMPQHTHTLQADAHNTTCVGAAKNNLLSTAALTSQLIYAVPSNPVTLNAGTVTTYGGTQPHSNLQPFLVLQYCIATQGIFPARS